MSEIGMIGLLGGLGDGKVMDDFHKRFHELLRAVRSCGDKGKVVLTLSVEPDPDQEEPVVSVRGEVTATIPLPKRRRELFFLTDDCRLSRRNPRQPERPENTVKMPPVEDRADLDGKSRAAGERS